MRILIKVFLLSAVVSISTIASPAFAQTNSPPSARRGTAVALVDVGYIFENYKAFTGQMEAMKSEIKAYEEKVNADRQRIIKLREKLEDFKPGTPEYKSIETDLAQQLADVQVQTELKRKDVLEREAEVYFRTYDQIQREVAAFSRQYGIGLVMRFDSSKTDSNNRNDVLKSVNRAVIYQSQLNITRQILERLNADQQLSSNTRPVFK